jgi:hypothetical protein
MFALLSELLVSQHREQFRTGVFAPPPALIESVMQIEKLHSKQIDEFLRQIENQIENDAQKRDASLRNFDVGFRKQNDTETDFGDLIGWCIPLPELCFLLSLSRID